MPISPERLYQLGFDDHFQRIIRRDVTPEGFTGLQFPQREKPVSPQLGRFVREAQEAMQIANPGDAARYLRGYIFTPFEDFDQEEMWCLCLNTKSVVTHEAMLYRGTVNTVYVRVAEFFKVPIQVNSPSFILAHCHPSGDPTPSPEDIHCTRAAMEIADHLQLELLDHLIIGSDKQWVSIKNLLLAEQRRR
jgi:DNA repair protein RadC